MTDYPPKVAAIHDLSCAGRCSLTVALPILSAAGIECSVLPTALLSTHLGGFTGYVCHDLTEQLLPIAEHWKREGRSFQALYSGFLCSPQQIDIVSQIFDLYHQNQVFYLVDPVMADNGKLYRMFTSVMVEAMRRLCSRADLVTPNVTEAALLIDVPYQDGPHSAAYIEQLLNGLQKLGCREAVLTGVRMDEHTIGAACIDHQTQRVRYALSEAITGYYPGTGDIFAAVLLAALLHQYSLPQAMQQAVAFTHDCIQRTQSAGTDPRWGVLFEPALASFMQQLKAPNRE